MSIDQSTLNKGQIRKLNALRKSVGDNIAEDAFSKWMKSQTKTPKDDRDPVADALVTALVNLQDDTRFRLGNKGFVVRRAKGKKKGSVWVRCSEGRLSRPSPMRHILTLVVLLFPAPAFGETVDDLVEPDGLHYKKSSYVPFTGKVTEKYQRTIRNGKISLPLGRISLQRTVICQKNLQGCLLFSIL